MREIAEFLSLGSVMPVPVDNYRRIADEIERWVVEGGVDGFNFFSIDSPWTIQPLLTSSFPNCKNAEYIDASMRRALCESTTSAPRRTAECAMKLACSQRVSRTISHHQKPTVGQSAKASSG